MSGHPKIQKTFARVMGYVEQSDIHSPNVSGVELLLHMHTCLDTRLSLFFCLLSCSSLKLICLGALQLLCMFSAWYLHIQPDLCAQVLCQAKAVYSKNAEHSFTHAPILLLKFHPICSIHWSLNSFKHAYKM